MSIEMSALGTHTLTGTVAAAIGDEEPLSPNRLAWVTSHFLIIRNAERQNHTIIPLIRLAGIDVVKTPYSGLLAIAAGVFIIAAAAFASKQGDGAAIPCALLGAFLVAGYFGSRRANITFRTDSGVTETVSGTLSEGTQVIKLIEAARSRISETAEFSPIHATSSFLRPARPAPQPALETAA